MQQPSSDGDPKGSFKTCGRVAMCTATDGCSRVMQDCNICCDGWYAITVTIAANCCCLSAFLYAEPQPRYATLLQRCKLAPWPRPHTHQTHSKSPPSPPPFPPSLFPLVVTTSTPKRDPFRVANDRANLVAVWLISRRILSLANVKMRSWLTCSGKSGSRGAHLMIGFHRHAPHSSHGCGRGSWRSCLCDERRGGSR